MHPKSTNPQPLPFTLMLTAILLTLVTTVGGQQECAARAFPPRIPMRSNQTLAIDLEQYFQGSNLTYTVRPNNQYASVEPVFQCTQIYSDNIGRVIASQYLAENNILATLVQTVTSRYVLTYLQILPADNNRLDLPNPQNYSNCTHFDLHNLNHTHLLFVATCAYTPNPYSLLLVTTVIHLGAREQVQWQLIPSPIYTYTEILKSEVIITGDVLLRWVTSSANSYVQIWAWEQQTKEILGVIDKTFLGVGIFNLQSVKIFGSILLLLDYNSGVHIIRLSGSRKPLLLGSLSLPFYEQFDYSPETGVLLLGKKGKVVSAVVNNLEHTTIAVGLSFNLLNYQRIIKIQAIDNKVIVLGQNLLSVFTVSSNRNAYRHYYSYPLQGATHFFNRQQQGQTTQLLIVRQLNSDIIQLECKLQSPILTLHTPPQSLPLTISAKSNIQGQTSTCQQRVSLQQLQTSTDLIYNNGYIADNQVLFANLPGQGLIQLQKYGVGRNLTYSVTTDPDTKIQYKYHIYKDTSIGCSIQNRPIPLNAQFYYLSSWLNILVVQVTEQLSLKYFYCEGTPNDSACTYAIQIPNMKPLDQTAYSLIQQTSTYSVSYEALLQVAEPDLTVLVRKMLIVPASKLLQISVYCTIKIDNYLSTFSNVTQMEINNGLLYLVLPFNKKINIYDISSPDCLLTRVLNPQAFRGQYFSPRSIYFDHTFSRYRQPILFVKQWDQLLAIRLRGDSLTPNILNTHLLPQPQNGSLIITLPLLTFISYRQHTATLYHLTPSHQLQYLRTISLEPNQVLDTFSQDQRQSYKSLQGSHLALRTINTVTLKQQIKIYQLNQLISTAQLYTAIPLTEQQQGYAFLDMEGGQTVLMLVQLIRGPSSQSFFCRSRDLHLQPSLLFDFQDIRSTIQAYSQNITVTLNTPSHYQIHQFAVSLTNLGQGISRGSGFPGRGTSLTASSDITLDDSYWFQGSVYDYDFDCRNCKDRITFKPKISTQSKEDLPFTSQKFFLNHKDHILQASAGPFLVEMQYNYSAWPLPSSTDSGYQLKHIFAVTLGSSECIDTLVVAERQMVLSLCQRSNQQEGRQYFLTAVSTASFKTFVIGETQLYFQTGDMPKLKYSSNLVVVYASSMAVVLTLWQVEGQLQFIQLDQIDKEDIVDTICALELLSNSSNPHEPLTQVLFSLVVTQCSNQLYYSSFSIYLQQQKIIDEEGHTFSFSVPNLHVSYSQILNLPKLWSQQGIQIPSDSQIIQTLTRYQEQIIEDQVAMSLLVLFDRFHSYQFKLRLSKSNRIIKSIAIEGVFYKYGSNIAKSASWGDYLVIKYILDIGFGKLSQLYGCFDINNFVVSQGSTKEHYHFATYVFSNYKEGTPSESEESFPWLLDGHRIFQLHHEHLQVLNITSTLTANISGLQNPQDPSYQQLYTQTIIITANNPTSARSATIILKSVDQFILTDLQIGLMAVGAIVLLLILVLAGRVVLQKLRKYLKLVRLVEPSEVEDAQLGWQQQERRGLYRINLSQRGSTDV